MPVYDFSSGFNALNQGIGAIGKGLQEANLRANTAQFAGQLAGGDIDSAMTTAAANGDVDTLMKLYKIKTQQAGDLKFGAAATALSGGGAVPTDQSGSAAPSTSGGQASTVPTGGEGSASLTTTRSGAEISPTLKGQVWQTPTGPVDAQAASWAVHGVESKANDYQSIGPVVQKGSYAGDRAFGLHQVMGNNIGPWTQEVLGTPMTRQQFLASPEAQDKVFAAKFGEYAQQYGLAGAANKWFTGSPNPDPDRTDQYMRAGDYGNTVTSNYAGLTKQMPAAAGGQMAPSRVARAPVGAPVAAPIQVASAGGAIPTPDAGPVTPSSGAGPSAPQASVSPTGAAPAATTPGAPVAIPFAKYGGKSYTREQAVAQDAAEARDMDSAPEAPNTEEWDAAAKAAGVVAPPAAAPAAAPAGGAAPSYDPAKDPVVQTAAKTSPQIARSLAQTLPGSQERQLRFANLMLLAGNTTDPEGKRAYVKALMDIDQKNAEQFQKQVREPTPAELQRLPKAASGSKWMVETGTGKPFTISGGNESATRQITDPEERAALGYPPLPGTVQPGQLRANGQPFLSPEAIHVQQDNAGKVTTDKPGQVINIGDKGVSEVNKEAITALKSGYGAASAGSVPALDTINRMQQAVNGGMVSGWGVAQDAVKSTAALFRKLGYGDTSIVNTQQYLQNATADYVQAAKSTFTGTGTSGGRITDADVKVAKLMTGGDDAQTAEAIQSAILVQRERMLAQIALHNKNLDKFQKANEKNPELVQQSEMWRINPEDIPKPAPVKLQPGMTPAQIKALNFPKGTPLILPDGGEGVIR